LDVDFHSRVFTFKIKGDVVAVTNLPVKPLLVKEQVKQTGDRKGSLEDSDVVDSHCDSDLSRCRVLLRWWSVRRVGGSGGL
jgi:hypothetical protein